MLSRWFATAFIGVIWAGLGAGGSQGQELYRPLCIDGSCVKWQGTRAGEQLVLTWAIASRDLATETAFNCRQLRPPETLLTRSRLARSDFHRALASAFELWERAANIVFVEASDQSKADIVIGEQGEASGYAFTNVTVSKPPNASPGIEKALICLNPSKPWKIGYDGNLKVYDLVHTFAHEIGHAIGLDHPDKSGHLMSFRYEETGLSEGDVLGAVALYGRRDRGITLVTTGTVRASETPLPGAVRD